MEVIICNETEICETCGKRINPSIDIWHLDKFGVYHNACMNTARTQFMNEIKKHFEALRTSHYVIRKFVIASDDYVQQLISELSKKPCIRTLTFMICGIYDKVLTGQTYDFKDFTNYVFTNEQIDIINKWIRDNDNLFETYKDPNEIYLDNHACRMSRINELLINCALTPNVFNIRQYENKLLTRFSLFGYNAEFGITVVCGNCAICIENVMFTQNVAFCMKCCGAIFHYKCLLTALVNTYPNTPRICYCSEKLSQDNIVQFGHSGMPMGLTFDNLVKYCALSIRHNK